MSAILAVNVTEGVVTELYKMVLQTDFRCSKLKKGMYVVCDTSRLMMRTLSVF